MGIKKINSCFFNLFYLSLGIFFILWLLLYFVRGPFIKEPIENYLSSKLGIPLSIGQIDYNLLYPGTIAIHELHSPQNFKIQTLYAEIDIWSYILGKSKKINIYELDVIKPEFSTTDYVLIANTLTSKIASINKIWIKELTTKDYSGISIEANKWNLEKSWLQNTLNNAALISFHDAKTPWKTIDNGTIELTCQENSCIARVNVKLDNGAFNTLAYLNISEQKAFLTEIEISNLKLSINDFNVPNWEISLGPINAHNVDIPLANILQQNAQSNINGFTGIIEKRDSNVSLKGSFLDILISNHSIANGHIELDSNGNFKLNGSIEEQGELIVNGALNPHEQNLTIEQLLLKDFETTYQHDYFNFLEDVQLKNITIKELKCEKCSILSSLEKFKFFTYQSDLNITNLIITPKSNTFNPFNTLTNVNITYDKLKLANGELGLFTQRFSSPKLVSTLSLSELQATLNYYDNTVIELKISSPLISKNSSSKKINAQEKQISENAQLLVVGKNINLAHIYIPDALKMYGLVDAKYEGTIQYPQTSEESFLTNGTLQITANTLVIDGINIEDTIQNIRKNLRINDWPQFKNYVTKIQDQAIDELSELELTANITQNIIDSAKVKSMTLGGVLNGVLTTYKNPQTINFYINYHDTLEDKDFLLEINLWPGTEQMEIIPQINYPIINPTAQQ